MKFAPRSKTRPIIRAINGANTPSHRSDAPITEKNTNKINKIKSMGHNGDSFWRSAENNPTPKLIKNIKRYGREKISEKAAKTELGWKFELTLSCSFGQSPCC